MRHTGPDRRSFLTTGAGAAIGSALAGTAGAQNAASDGDGLLKVGIILGGGNHAQNMWARLINAVPDTNNIPYTPRMTGMRLTHVWAPLPEWAETFAATFRVPNVVREFDGMVGKVDGMMIDAFFGTPYNHHFARPYIEAGIPLFVNRPFADSVAKAKVMTGLAARHGTPIMTGSSFEHLECTMSIRNRYPHDSVGPYEAWNARSDFYSHGVHGLLFAYGCVRGGMEAVGHRTESWIEGGGTTDVVYRDRGNGPFMGRIYDFSTEKYLVAMRFRDTPQYYGFGQADWDRFMWIHLLRRMEEMFATGSMPDTHEQIVEKTAMFVAAFHSILRGKGDLVGLDTLDDDWCVGPPWGHSGNPSMEEQNVYRNLFGEEKGELRPDMTMG